MQRIMRLLSWINVALDLLALNLSLIIAYGTFFRMDTVLIRQIVPYAFIINFLWLFIQSVFKIYDNYLYRNSISIYRRTINAFVSFGFGVSLVFLLVLQDDLSSSGTRSSIYFFCFSTVLFGVLLCITRLVVLSIRKKGRKHTNSVRNVIIVGHNHSSRTLSDLFSGNHGGPYNVMAIFHDQDKEPEERLYKGSTNDCIPFLKENRVDEIFCTLPGISKEHINDLMHEADRNLTRFRLVPDYYEYFPAGNVNIEMIDNIPVMSSRPEPLEHIVNAAFKRLFDIFFSLFVIVFILSWLLPVIAVLIKITSPGPVFFKQLRSGRDNQPFYCLKFRSMRVNANADKLQAVKNDNRITPLGAFMRKTSLDELPQFFNVLIGNMSIVGPRPHMLAHTEQYAALIDKFMVRHFLKPGITGWAQVTGLRGETRTIEDMARRVEADVWYLENWSFLLDMKIIFLTIWNIFRGEKNAY